MLRGIVDSISSPTISIIIIITLFLYIKVTYSEIDSKPLVSSYKDIVTKGQWYRIISCIVIHTTLTHFLLSVFTLWQLRKIEVMLGSLYFLRYSILLVFFESFMSNMLAYILVSGKLVALGDVGISFGMRFANVNVFGSSSLVLAWLAYASTTTTMYSQTTEPFYVWGLVPIPWFLAPLITVLSYQILAPPNISLSNVSGLVSGYVLSSGLISVLPNAYWSICILFDIFLLVVIKSAFVENTSSNGASATTNNYNGLEIVRPPDSNNDIDDDTDSTDNNTNNNDNV